MSDPPFRSLDFLYTPSHDVAADLAVFEDVLGARVHFAIDGMGTRVAAVELAGSAPLILLTGVGSPTPTGAVTGWRVGAGSDNSGSGGYTVTVNQ